MRLFYVFLMVSIISFAILANDKSNDIVVLGMKCPAPVRKLGELYNPPNEQIAKLHQDGTIEYLNNGTSERLVHSLVHQAMGFSETFDPCTGKYVVEKQSK